MEQNRYNSEIYSKAFHTYSLNPINTLLDIMEQAPLLDFRLPNEIIEMVISYLSIEELLDLASVATGKLKSCTFSALRKKLCGKY